MLRAVLATVALAHVERRLANAGTTTVRVKLRGPALRTAKRLVLRASAAGAIPVRTTIRPR